MTYPPGRSGPSWPDVTSLARCRQALAWLATRWRKSPLCQAVVRHPPLSNH